MSTVKIKIKVDGKIKTIDLDIAEYKDKLMRRACNQDEIQKILIYILKKIT